MSMDLSKAFDGMPQGLLIAKLHAYGMSKYACCMPVSYMWNQRQRVQISGEVSDLSTINCGVPKWSVLGPLLYNIFLNDCFSFRYLEILHIMQTIITVTVKMFVSKIYKTTLWIMRCGNMVPWRPHGHPPWKISKYIFFPKNGWVSTPLLFQTTTCVL